MTFRVLNLPNYVGIKKPLELYSDARGTFARNKIAMLNRKKIEKRLIQSDFYQVSVKML